MDRRFLIAIVLSVLILIVFQTWIAPPPKRPPAEQAAAVGDSAEAPVSPPRLYQLIQEGRAGA